MTLGAAEAAQARDRFMILLVANAGKLEVIEKSCTQALEDRERLIAEARKAGVLWTDIAHASGLTPRRVQKIHQSAKARTPSGQDDSHD
jgi:hypothetical protein